MVIHRTSNRPQFPVPHHTKKGLSWKTAGKVIGRVLLALLLILLLLAVFGTAAHAAGLVDDTVDAANEYSKYPLDNYQLDFYVDSGWDWLPWNWLDGIGKQVMYGLYAITNFIWTISLYLSNATGYLIQEAYSLDFISSTADSIGKNMQTLAGVTTGGLSSEGFYIGFLLILILVVGIYVAYTGLIKRETTKAIHAVVNFMVVFVLSAAFIAYAPDYIGKINEFSADISNASLTLGTKIVLPNSESQGKDSVDLIRDSLFSIQVKQPWLLLQYGNSNALKGYLTGELQALNVDTVRKDIPVSSALTDFQIWEITEEKEQHYQVTYTVEQRITEGESGKTVRSAYQVTVYVDGSGNLTIIQNPTITSVPVKSGYTPKAVQSDGTVDSITTEEINEFLTTFFKLYPTATAKELTYYVNDGVLKPVGKEYIFSELVNPVYNRSGNQVTASLAVKYLDNQTMTTQVSQFDLVLEKNGENWKIVK